MRANPVKKKLAKGERVYGTMILEFVSPGLPAILKAAGCDYVIYDMEHSGLSLTQMKEQLALCRGLDLVPIVRPAAKAYHLAAGLLDAGALGLLFPMVESKEEAEELVSWTRYPPKGVRGAAFGVAHDDYTPGDVKAKMKKADDRTLILALLETAKGAEKADEILSVPGIDAAHLGQFDLSVSLGHPGEFDHPEVAAAIRRIAKAAKKNGKAAACMSPNASQSKAWAKLGFNMLSYSGDIWLLQNSLAEGIKTLKA